MLSRMNVQVSVFALACSVVLGARINNVRTELDDEAASQAASDSNATVASRFGVAVASRFEMHHVVWRKCLETGYLEHYGKPEIALPSDILNDYIDTKGLFAGSFGEAWAATDKNTGQRVVVKMFYTTARGRKVHLTHTIAANDRSGRLADQLQDAAGECQVAQNMQKYALHDPIGASRLMQCYEDHATLGTSITGHTVTELQPLYQVLEDCGGLPLYNWFLEKATRGKSREPAYVETNAVDYVKTCLGLFKNLMEGLNYLTKYEDKWVHHDLKPENVVVKELGNGKQVLKIIDFGSVTPVSAENGRKALVSTVLYAPPEWFPIAQGFDWKHPSSYDTYQAANILAEIMTGKTPYNYLAQKAPLPSSSQIRDCINKMYRRNRMRWTGMTTDRNYNRFKSYCDEDIRFENVKGSHGYERSITEGYGKDKYKNVEVPKEPEQVPAEKADIFSYVYDGITDFFKEEEAPQYKAVKDPWKLRSDSPEELGKFESWLYGGSDQRGVYDEFQGVVTLFRKESAAESFHRTFMKMFAYDPSVRATPDQVLATRFMQKVPEVVDPDYDARKAMGTKIQSGSGNLGQVGGDQEGAVSDLVAPRQAQVQKPPDEEEGQSMTVPCPDFLQGLLSYFRICVESPNGQVHPVN